MAYKQELYIVLTEMVRCAEKGESGKMLELNKRFDMLFFKVFPKGIGSTIGKTTDEGRAYDNCRQSCIMSTSNWITNKREIIADATAKFLNIKKP